MEEPHPWGVFLEARIKCITWMREKMKRNDSEIAQALSMDEKQVYLIRTRITGNSNE